MVELPVVLDTQRVAQSTAHMKDFLRNQGYFFAQVADTIVYKGRKAYVRYKVRTGLSYLIDSVSFEIEDRKLAARGSRLAANSLLAKNEIYTHTLVGAERSRLTEEIRNMGYYKFSGDNIAFELDTMDKAFFHNLENPFESAINFITLQHQGKKPSLDVKVEIHASDDSLAFQPFRFRNVYVYPDYVDTADLRNEKMTEELVKDIVFRYHEKYVHPGILEDKIFIRPDALFSQEDYNQTIRHLNDLGIFQYVRVFITQNRQDTLEHTLNCYILLHPTPKYEFMTNLEASGGDLYVIGSAINASVTDKNFLKGANQLSVTASYGVEFGRNSNKDLSFLNSLFLSTQNLGLNFRLTFPKFLFPISEQRFNRRALPRTVLNVGGNYFSRQSYFDLQSINGSFGYVWNETATKSWSVKPVFVNTLNLSNVSDSFAMRMQDIPAIRNAYQETLIEGEQVELIINTEGTKRFQYAFLKLGFEEAGGLLSGVKALGRGMGAPMSFNHANYFRFDFDARQYLNGVNSSLAFRFYGGVGIPYGNSTTLPYLRQYFVGGAYSIRGWRPRVLGPGSFYDSTRQLSEDNLFLDQSGDIKLELNSEYRFNMFQMFSGAIGVNGAVFVDAGNIWLTRKDEQLPGADFQLRHLYQDIAVSGGAGLRVDFGGFLVIRFDWAMPFKKPYIFEHNGWVFSDIDFKDRNWRRQNINFNLAIGYPF